MKKLRATMALGLAIVMAGAIAAPMAAQDETAGEDPSATTEAPVTDAAVIDISADQLQLEIDDVRAHVQQLRDHVHNVDGKLRDRIHDIDPGGEIAAIEARLTRMQEHLTSQRQRIHALEVQQAIIHQALVQEGLLTID